jgi:Putative zinc-finger
VAEFNQFGNAQPSRSPDPAHCAQCEAMLTDALDRTLSAEDQAVFDRHLAICPDCSRMFIDTKLGVDLLAKLHGSRPQPSATLLERILATTGPAADLSASSMTQQKGLLSGPMAIPATVSGISGGYIPGTVYATRKVLPFHKRLTGAFKFANVRHTLMQPRLAMTAAMAFFSIALTLNLTGVRITDLRASDFTPSSLKRTFYDTNARVVRSIDNLRVVYELESRVRDLQRDSDSSTAPAPQVTTPAPAQSNPSEDQHRNDPNQEEQKRSNPRPRSGSSRSLGLDHSLEFTASLAHPGSSPEPVHERRKIFTFFTPTVFNSVEQGGQA